MNKQLVISAAFRHAKLSENGADKVLMRDRHGLVSEVFDLLFENLPMDTSECLSVIGDVVTYTYIVDEVLLQATVTARIAMLPEELKQLELLAFHSVPRELIDEQYRKYIIDNEKQEETSPQVGTNDQGETGR